MNVAFGPLLLDDTSELNVFVRIIYCMIGSQLALGRLVITNWMQIEYNENRFIDIS